MNMMASTCTKCSTRLLVLQIEWESLEAHICVKCHTVSTDDEFDIDDADLNLYNDFGIDDSEIIDWEVIADNIKKEVTKCECGSYVAGIPGHSRWCAMHPENR